jgi:hypothetical protein
MQRSRQFDRTDFQDFLMDLELIRPDLNVANALQFARQLPQIGELGSL